MDGQGIHDTLVQVLATLGSSAGLLLLRAVSRSLSDLVDEFQSVRTLPSKVEDAITRIETKFDQRMAQNEAKIETIMGVLANERRCKNFDCDKQP